MVLKLKSNIPAIEGGVPVRKTFLLFNAPFVGADEIQEVVDTLKSGWIGTGKKTYEFERKFAEYTGAKYAIALNSCTAALHLSLLASGIKQGDEAITSSFTFAATANVIIHAGAKPVFADIELDTLNIDPYDIEKKITNRTKAILPVHFAGLPCNLDAIRSIAKKHNLVVIEDAAHALGAKYNCKMIGNCGNLTCFSFYPNKNITTGEGGMVTTNNSKYAKLINIYRLHGLSSDAWCRFTSKDLIKAKIVYPGYKYNMTDISASIGIHQLEKLEKFIEKKEKIALVYDEGLKDIPGIKILKRQESNNATRHALHLYVVILDLKRFKVNRDMIVSALRVENIGAAIHYEAIHLHPYYKNNVDKKELPNSTFISKNIFSLPISSSMSEEDIKDVITAVKKVCIYYYRKS